MKLTTHEKSINIFFALSSTLFQKNKIFCPSKQKIVHVVASGLYEDRVNFEMWDSFSKLPAAE